MTTQTNSTSTNKTKINAGYETSTFALGVGMTMAALIGIWGTACLVSALISNGPVSLVKNYILALVG